MKSSINITKSAIVLICITVILTVVGVVCAVNKFSKQGQTVEAGYNGVNEKEVEENALNNNEKKPVEEVKNEESNKSSDGKV